MFTHIPVLLQLVIKELHVKANEKYIDATLGGGGHTEEILKHGGMVLGIDQDEDAIQHVLESKGPYIESRKLTVAQGNFRDIGQIARKHNFEKVSGILFDLGVSSHQLDESQKGFSIRRDEALDMRMDKNVTVSARDIISKYSEQDLTDIFIEFGEEDKAHEVAKAIVAERGKNKIETTGQLVAVIERVIKRTGKLHPATKVFQALRIEVNQELRALKQGMLQALTLLSRHGRILVISFHSLEDRMVKRQFDSWEKEGRGSIVTPKPLTASLDEELSNPRARSAKLRVFEAY